MIEEKSPLLQIAYAADVRDMSTYEQMSRLVPMRKCRIMYNLSTAWDVSTGRYVDLLDLTLLLKRLARILS